MLEKKENTNGKYDERNKLNDLTGKEWIQLTKSFWESERSKDDKPAFDHPAPFLIKDIEKLVSFFTKKEMIVMDPFVGSGTTMIAANNLNRKAIGIDLNPDYYNLARSRFDDLEMDPSEYRYVVGNSINEIHKLETVDYIVTSPPYHNILKNKNSGLRSDNSDKGYRNGSRQGIEYYSDKDEDLGNQESYEDFLMMLQKVMEESFKVLRNDKYLTIIMSDFTVNKKETNVQGDVVKLMEEIGFDFVGTAILLQDSKPLYPFGYPYAYVINHHHQNMIHFRKRV